MKKEAPPANVRQHHRLCIGLTDLYETKNKAYGDSFRKTYKEYGPAMLCIRLDDKLSRVKQLLLKGEAPNDESVIDTLMDLANYSIMGIMELQRYKKEKEGDDSDSQNQIP